jgi:MoxR-like ATPase
MAHINSPFVSLTPGDVLELDESDALAVSWHQWSRAEIDALTLALAARRPLLVRGEPGTGKTQLARAAAKCLGWEFHAETIHPRFEPDELRFRFDAVKRLADAQAKEASLDEHRYWRPGVLWKAFGWQSALNFLPDAERLKQPKGHVVLIDEIDKADSDLPNSLLEVLAQRSFRVEPVPEPIGGPKAPLPLIVITTNEERELPAAFLRRCIVLSLAPDRDYEEWLVRRGLAHFGVQTHIKGREQARLDPDVLQQAAMQLTQDRDSVKRANLSPPGLAEYLDLLYALLEITREVVEPAERKKTQLEWLGHLNAYAFLKHSVDDAASPISQSARVRRDGPIEADA